MQTNACGWMRLGPVQGQPPPHLCTPVTLTLHKHSLPPSPHPTLLPLAGIKQTGMESCVTWNVLGSVGSTYRQPHNRIPNPPDSVMVQGCLLEKCAVWWVNSMDLRVLGSVPCFMQIVAGLLPMGPRAVVTQAVQCSCAGPWAQ